MGEILGRYEIELLAGNRSGGLPLLRRKKKYDRNRILEAAAQARRRRKPRKALELYREVLAHEPNNADLLRKVAPLLAETKQLAEAWQTYQKTIEQFRAKGFTDRAIGVCREACQQLPGEVSAWMGIAELEVARGRPTDAVSVLLEGRSRFRSRRKRSAALQLLERARRIDASNFEVSFDLAHLLARDGARTRARRVLDELAGRSRARELRRVRARIFVLFPSPRSAWGWAASWVRA